MDHEARHALIEDYRNGYRAVTEALEGITESELDSRLSPNQWTAREIVHHLGDSEMTSSIRLRRLLVEDQPLIPNYDEEEYARRLHYNRPISTSLAAFRAVHEANLTLLERLTEADWRRTGTHSVSGPYSVEIWLEIYAAHGRDHAAQIRQARSAPAT